MKLYEINRYAYSAIDKFLLEGNDISFFYNKLFDNFVCFIEKPESKCVMQLVGEDQATGKRVYRKQQPGFNSFSGSKIQNLLLRFVKESAEKEGFRIDAKYNGEFTSLESLLREGTIFKVSAEMLDIDDMAYVGEFSVIDEKGNIVPYKYMSSTYGVEELFSQAEKVADKSAAQENAKN